MNHFLVICVSLSLSLSVSLSLSYHSPWLLWLAAVVHVRGDVVVDKVEGQQRGVAAMTVSEDGG